MKENVSLPFFFFFFPLAKKKKHQASRGKGMAGRLRGVGGEQRWLCLVIYKERKKKRKKLTVKPLYVTKHVSLLCRDAPLRTSL